MTKWILSAGTLAIAAVLLIGCRTEGGGFSNLSEATGFHETGTQNNETVKVGDVVTFAFRSIPNDIRMTGKVREDGTVTLLLDQTFVAAGKTIYALDDEVRDRYRSCWSDLPPFPSHAYYFVDGEVKQPNRYAYNGPITVLRAISSAGNFTSFANRAKVKLTRNDGTSFTINCKKSLNDSSLDLELFPGDRIVVPRKLF